MMEIRWWHQFRASLLMQFVFSGTFCCFGLEGGVSEFEIAADQRGNFRVKFFLRRLTHKRQNLRLTPLSRFCHDAHQIPYRYSPVTFDAYSSAHVEKIE